MDSSKLEKGLLKITAALVGLFSLVLMFNLLSFKPKNTTTGSTIKSESGYSSKATPAQERSPAALADGVSWEAVRNIPCINDGESYNVDSLTSRLRIGAKLCRTKQEFKETTIVNKSNGFVATVFHINSKEFTTDLIDLIPGENLIHVSHLLNDGKTMLSQVVINYK